MTWQFDAETAVSPVGPGRWSATLSSAWNIGDNPNGGYATALVLRALAEVAGHEAPISMTTHFLRPALGGAPAAVHTEVIRSGRRTSTVAGYLVQDSQERLRVLATFGDLGGGGPDGAPRLTVARPELPPPQDCRDRGSLEQGVELPILGRVEVRVNPDQAEPGTAGAAEVSGWIRLADGRPTDATVLPFFADAFPPSLFGLLGRIGWVPTIELTVHVRHRPAPGWVQARFVTHDLQDGRMIEDGDLWDADGRLVARSRQLGLLMT
jgi:acyl-CoA thioesterase